MFCKFVALFGSGEWRVTVWTSDVVRYRDGLSLVVRYTVAALRESTGSRGSRVFDAKAYLDRATADAHITRARVAIVEPNSRDGVRTGFAPPVRAR